jgi:hypothetical protein
MIEAAVGVLELLEFTTPVQPVRATVANKAAQKKLR